MSAESDAEQVRAALHLSNLRRRRPARRRLARALRGDPDAKRRRILDTVALQRNPRPGAPQ